jgi:cation:H+ antiporter
MITWLLGLSGIALLFGGGELAVRGSVSLARRLSLSPLLIGIVIVGFMTSMPELVVSLRAITGGNPLLAVGNVVGSDIVNILLVLGIATLIAPIAAGRVCARRDAIMMTAALLAITAAAAFGTIERWQGLLMVASLVAYVVWSYRSGSTRSTPEARLHIADAADAACLPPAEPIWLIVLLLVGGLGSLVLGATWVVTAATTIARSMGLSEAAIGLTVVSLGTTLPELSAAIASARHGNSELVIGNVLGSNIFNILGVLGLCALVTPVPVEHLFVVLDLPLLILLSLVLMRVFSGRTGLRRWAGAVMVVAYVAYFGLRFLV